jgi:serine/threonine-protein kinase RsbW
MAGLFERTIDATIANIPVIADSLEEYLAREGVDPAVIPDIELAVDEAVTNIIMHGYRGEKGTIRVTCSVGPRRVRVVIRDRAPAFNPLTAQEPDISAGLADRVAGGMGIHLIRKVMDAVRYEYSGTENILTLEKTFAP